MSPNFLGCGSWAWLREWRGGTDTALAVGWNHLKESPNFVEMPSSLWNNNFAKAELRLPARLDKERVPRQDAQKGRPARPQAKQEPEAYPLGVR